MILIQFWTNENPTKWIIQFFSHVSQVPSNPCPVWLLHCSAQRDNISIITGSSIWRALLKRKGTKSMSSGGSETKRLPWGHIWAEGEGKCSGGEAWGRLEHILGKENSTHKTCAGREPCDQNAKRGSGVTNHRVSKGLAAWVWIPDLTLPSCVLLDKWLDFSVPHFLTYKGRIIIVPPSKGCGEGPNERARHKFSPVWVFAVIIPGTRWGGKNKQESGCAGLVGHRKNVGLYLKINGKSEGF